MMKKLILILTVMIAACNPAAEKTTEAQEGAGFFLPIEGEKFVVASDAVTEMWQNYIKAHNDRDLEAIMAMDSDSIVVEADDGRVIRGKEMHKAALADWFAAEDPKWQIFWAMPYKAVTGGEEWIVAGHQVKTTVDGKEKVQLTMIDGEIKDGKITQFYVYSKRVPEPPKTDSESAE